MSKDLILDPRFNWKKNETELVSLIQSKYPDQVASGIVKVKPKDWKRLAPGNRGLMLRTVEKGSNKPTPLVAVPNNASLSTIIHEVQHRDSSLKSPEKDWYTNLDSIISEELDAETSAYKTKGREPTWRIVDAAISSAVRRGYSKAEIMGSIVRYLDREGYTPIPKSTRSWIWTRIQGWRELYGKKQRS